MAREHRRTAGPPPPRHRARWLRPAGLRCGTVPGRAPNARAGRLGTRTIGTTRAKGDELRQVLVDFAYQLARHAYRAGGCQEPRSFPGSLPRLSEGRVLDESPG
ncbi:hypothetical protein [Streptomyces somaliensis]|uniref:hypothetical protein n=1 Tax=Streptomyces somaliensis TaxID=78355 RepID=UPI0034E945CC|nr:hypothetical protein [Streptomyces somaliensis]